MTKAEWISVIQKTMMKIDEQRIYAPQLIERHIQSVYEQMYNELYASQPKGMWKYVRKYTEEEAETPSAGISGLAFPKQPIQLPRIGGGLFRFEIDGTSVVITDYERYFTIGNTKFDTQGVQGKYVAAVMDNELYVNVAMLTPPFSLNYYLIPKFTALSATDEVLIPGGAEDHFIDRVIDTIRHMTPVDLFNDNTVQ